MSNVRFLKRAGAAAAAAALTLQMAFVPAMAADASGSAATVEINVGGEVSGAEIDASLRVVGDMAAQAGSLEGTVNLSGMDLSFAGYMDANGIIVQLPLVEKLLSYDFHADPSGSFLAQIIGEEQLQSFTDMINGGGTDISGAAEAAAGQIQEILTNALNSLELTPVDEKECQVGGGSVLCQGASAVITGSFLQDLLNQILAVDAGGKTVGDVLNQAASMSQTAPDVYELAEQLGQLPDITMTVYLNESYPAEIDLDADGQTVQILIAGEADTPWTDIRVMAGGQQVLAAATEISESGISFALTGEENTEYCSFNLDLSAGTFAINAMGLPAPITGTFGIDEDGRLNISTEIMGISINVTAYAGGQVAKLDGETIELTSATQEELQEVLAVFGSLMGGSSDMSAAA